MKFLTGSSLDSFAIGDVIGIRTAHNIVQAKAAAKKFCWNDRQNQQVLEDFFKGLAGFSGRQI